ncbi:MAG: hypothetical protein LBQ31_04630 [Bacteroidales bacterium]|nr:hypothetical protein [Bacteroidales bacterium]
MSAVGSLRGKPPLLGLLQTSVCCGVRCWFAAVGKPPLLGLLQTSVCCGVRCWFAAGQAPAVGSIADERLLWVRCWFVAGQAPAVGSIADIGCEHLLLVHCGASPRCWVYCRRVSAVGSPSNKPPLLGSYCLSYGCVRDYCFAMKSLSFGIVRASASSVLAYSRL